ncbi:hypothetical protein EDB84DRAFT_1677320, partial [Lactarius hengduanensis]
MCQTRRPQTQIAEAIPLPQLPDIAIVVTMGDKYLQKGVKYLHLSAPHTSVVTIFKSFPSISGSSLRACSELPERPPITDILMGTPRGTQIFSYPLPSIGSSSAHPLQVSLPGDPSSGAVPHIGKITRDGLRDVLGQDESYRDATTISTLPDDVLLKIFNFYKEDYGLSPYHVCKWHVLVHVCQSWRQLVFASPQRLNLQISCTPGNPVRKHLGLWPPFPIIIYYSYPRSITPNNEDNVIAALEHPNRVCHVTLNITKSRSGNIARSMQEP